MIRRLARALLLAALVLSQGTLYAALFEARGSDLTIHSSSLTVSFRGPDVVGITNLPTGETYLRSPATYTLSDLTLSTATSEALSARGWIVNGDGTGATLIASDSLRSVSIAVSVDPATQEIVVVVSGLSEQSGVKRLSWGLSGFDMSAGKFVLPAQGGLSLTNRSLSARSSYYFGVEDSGYHWEAPLALFQAAQGGLAIYSTDTRALYKNLTVTANRESTANAYFGVSASAPWKAAKDAGPVEWRMAGYRGGWQAGARIYRDWHNDAMPAVALDGRRAWVSKIRTVVKIQYVSPYDPAVLDDLARRLDPAQTLLYLADWRSASYDTNYPDYTPATSAKAVADYAHRLGFHIMLHLNMIGVSPGNIDFAAVGEFQTRDEDGRQFLGWNWDRHSSTPNRFAYINPASGRYRELFLDRVRRAVLDLGADALHLHAAGWPPDDGGGLVDGRNFNQGAAQLHKDLLAAFPGVALGGEGTNDAIAPFQSFAQQASWPSGFDPGVTPPVPISAYVFPNVRPYGHLAFPNPNEAGFLEFFAQYEAQAVLPAFSLGFSAADRPNYGHKDVLRQMRVIQFFQQYRLQPDWDADWGGAVLKYGGDGVSAALTDDGAQVRFESRQAGQTRLLYERIHGSRQNDSSLRIPDWPAYNAGLTAGLDPVDQYWLETPSIDRNPVTITGLPDGVKLATGTDSLVTQDFAYFKIAPVASPSFDFRTSLWVARTGTIYNGVERDLANGATANLETVTAGGEARTAISAQPPYLGPAAGETFIEYDIAVPDGYSASLSFGAGVQDSAIGLRKGPMTFRVLVNGARLWRQDVSTGPWQPGSIDLTPFLNQNVRVRLETTPGPHDDTAFAWGGWSGLKLTVVDKPATADLTLSAPKSVLASSIVLRAGIAAVSDGVISIRGLPLGSTAIVFLKAPRPISIGQSLMDIPFIKSQSSGGQLAGPSEIPYAGDLGAAAAGGVRKQRALYGYSPSNGQLILSWPLRLTSAPKLYLSFSAGMSDGAAPNSHGVLMTVRVNGTVLWERNVNLPAQWVYGAVDLTAWAGQNILLELISDSLGQNSAHWTSWGELAVEGSQQGSCATALDSQADIVAPASGLTGSFRIVARAGCSWNAATGSDWIAAAPSSGEGSAVVEYSIAANLGPERRTDISVGGSLIRVTQRGI